MLSYKWMYIKETSLSNVFVVVVVVAAVVVVLFLFWFLTVKAKVKKTDYSRYTKR